VSSGFFVETFFAIYSCGDSSGFSPDSLFIYFSIEPKYNKDKCYKLDSVLWKIKELVIYLHFILL